jgi:hypothetical protein
MAPRKAAIHAVEDEAVEQPPQYELEPITDDLKSRLNVWGNSTMMLINQLSENSPGWAEVIGDMFNIILQMVKDAPE